MTSTSWRYQQRLRGQRPREYDAEVTYLHGEPGRQLARDLAAVTAELLAWARDHETIPNGPDLESHRFGHHDLDEAA